MLYLKKNVLPTTERVSNSTRFRSSAHRMVYPTKNQCLSSLASPYHQEPISKDNETFITTAKVIEKALAKLTSSNSKKNLGENAKNKKKNLKIKFLKQFPQSDQ